MHSKNPFKRSIAEHRNKVTRIRSSYPPAYSDEVTKQKISIKIVTEEIKLWIYRNNTSQPPYPTIFYIPGTAFVARESDPTDAIASHIAAELHGQVIVVNHRLAPEYPFPCGLMDAYRIMHRIAERSLLQVDRNNLVIGGYSSGANFAVSTSLGLRKEFSIRGLILISGLFDLLHSERELSNLPRSQRDLIFFERQDQSISENFIDWFLSHYLPPKIDRRNPLVSPLYSAQLSQLPPTVITTGKFDRFRHHSESLNRHLESEAHVLSRILRFPGNHSSLWVNPRISQFIGATGNALLCQTSIERPRITYNNQYSLFHSSLRTRASQKRKLSPQQDDQLSARMTKRRG